jgi:hypothetical protein
MNLPLRPNDERLPAVRARLFLLVRSLWKAGVVQVPLTLQQGDAPALQLLHPLWQRLRVELLGEQLLRDILPAIERHLASEVELHHQESHLTPRGSIDWPATWRRGLGRAIDAPLVTRHWVRRLDLPENYLAFHALSSLADNANLTLDRSLSLEEAAPLRHLRDRVRYKQQRPPWSRFSSQKVNHSMTNILIERVRQRLPSRPAYQALLAWWQQWQSWHQPTTGDHFLLAPELEPEWLFELLLLFEIVAALAKHLPVRQARALSGNSRTPAFIAETPAGLLTIFYRTGSMFKAYRSLEDIRGIPDIVLGLPSHEPTYIILDAKNYGATGHTQAIYKMLGYLYQFGYNPTGKHHFKHILAGILAFPTNEREGKALRHWQRTTPEGQSVMSFVLPPLPDEQFTGLEEVILWVQEQIAVARYPS